MSTSSCASRFPDSHIMLVSWLQIVSHGWWVNGFGRVYALAPPDGKRCGLSRSQGSLFDPTPVVDTQQAFRVWCVLCNSGCNPHVFRPRAPLAFLRPDKEAL